MFHVQSYRELKALNDGCHDTMLKTDSPKCLVNTVMDSGI